MHCFRIVITLIVFGVFSCGKKTNPVEQESSLKNVYFSYTLPSFKNFYKVGSSANLDKIRSIQVSLKNNEDSVIFLDSTLDVYDKNGSLVTEPIVLEIGTYKIYKYQLLDDSNQVLYASPVEGSKLAQLVREPLDIMFELLSDTVSFISPEVLSTEGRTPGDFGYNYFLLNEAPTFKLLLSVKYFNIEEQRGGFEQNVDVIVTVSDATGMTRTLSYDIQEGVNALPILDVRDSIYQFQFIRDELDTFFHSFSYDSLQFHKETLAVSPLEIVLDSLLYSDWTNSMQIPVRQGVSLSENLYDFPFLVRIDIDSIFSQSQSDGRDLRFSRGKRVLPYEIESWHPTDSYAAVWVLLDSVNASDEDDAIKMHWGNEVAEIGHNENSVFVSERYMAWWHFNQIVSNEIQDRTIHENNLSFQVENGMPNFVSGIAGNASLTRGMGEVLKQNRTTIQFDQEYSMCAWVTYGKFSEEERILDCKTSGGEDNVTLRTVGKTGELHWQQGSGVDSLRSGVEILTLNTWSHVCITKDDSGNASMYLNGEKVGATIFTQGVNDVIRDNCEVATALRGAIDEMSVSEFVYDSSYIKLSYENQKLEDVATNFQVTVSDIVVSGSDSITTVGNTTTLNATVLYSGIMGDGNVIWSSENPSIATVDSHGEVTAVGIGPVQIKVSSVEEPSIEKVHDIRVAVAVDSIRISGASEIVFDGQSIPLNVRVFLSSEDPVDNKFVTWSSSDSSVVVVDENGIITAVAVSADTVSITATSTLDGSISAQHQLTILEEIRVFGVRLFKSWAETNSPLSIGEIDFFNNDDLSTDLLAGLGVSGNLDNRYGTSISAVNDGEDDGNHPNAFHSTPGEDAEVFIQSLTPLAITSDTLQFRFSGRIECCTDRLNGVDIELLDSLGNVVSRVGTINGVANDGSRPIYWITFDNKGNILFQSQEAP